MLLTQPTSVRQRLDSIDLVRGLVMILMLLDHTRDFAHESAFVFDPLDPARTTPLLYATRWITHLCAPAFVLLAGVSVGLKRQRGASATGLAHLLWTRGLWLVFLEFAVCRFLIWFSFDYSLVVQLQVIWSIGVSMIVLAALVRLPVRLIGALGVVIIAGHHVLELWRVLAWFPPQSPVPTAAAKVWMVLHQGGFFPVADSRSPVVWANYPLLPWIGIMALGYALSEVYGWTPARRRRGLVLAGLAMAGSFVVLRGLNVYGDPRPWVAGANLTTTMMSFLNVNKYPPSLLFTLVTLAPSLLLLGLLDGHTLKGGPQGAVVTFGRVPFFFYVLQWPMAHAAGILVATVQGKDISPYFMHILQIISMPKPPDIGGPLWATYVMWIAGVCLLYWPCKWFAELKSRRRDRWLTYI
jgi:uncharacterized membrane protein